MTGITLLIVSQSAKYTTQILQGISLTKNKEDFFVIIRPHQAEESFNYKELLKKLGLNGKMDIKTVLYEQFKEANIILGVDSTGLFEAVLAKRPVIFCDGKGFLRHLGSQIINIYANEKSLVHAESPKQLGEILDNPFPYFAKALNYKTKRIGDIIVYA